MPTFLRIIGLIGLAVWALGLLLAIEETNENGTILQEMAGVLVMGFGALIGVCGLGLGTIAADVRRLPGYRIDEE